MKTITSEEQFIVFGAPDIREDEIREVVETLRGGWIGTGPRTRKFEQEFARRVGVEHALGVNSCTAALHLSLLAAGVEPGDEVITTAFTFAATVNAIIHSGARPVLADIDPVTMNIDVADVERRLTGRSRVVLPVHFAGRSCDMDALESVRAKAGLLMIEDCAHAVETVYHGRNAGTFGEFGCFSFYVTKNVVTGEGGMIVTDRADYAERLKILSLHGMSKDAWKRFGSDGYRHYQITEPGFKYNMMDVQAALGIHQLRRVDETWERRRQVWERYDAAFADLPVSTPAHPEPDTKHALHLYTLLLGDDAIERDEFLDRMTGAGIGVGVHYLSIPEHPYYREEFGWRTEDYPVAERTGRRIVSLPLSSRLSDSEVDRVIAAVRANIHP